MGDRYVLGNLMALLAQATYAQEGYAESIDLAETVEELGPPNDMVSRVTARMAKAKSLARLHQAELAETLAREAVAAVEQTDLLNVNADALLDLAEVLEIVGRQNEAAGAAERALELYNRKGNTVSEQHARSVLERLRPARSSGRR
jgi:tetratricopeptide (TPR) repeat protein